MIGITVSLAVASTYLFVKEYIKGQDITILFPILAIANGIMVIYWIIMFLKDKSEYEANKPKVSDDYE